MRRTFVLLSLVVICTACGSAPATSTVTAQQVIDAFNAQGLNVTDVRPSAANTNVPNSFQENVEFAIEEVAPKGGQLFICDTKQNCDAIFAYYDALKGLAGPYLYQSPNGQVVAQLNSGLTPETAAKFQSVVVGLQ
jgi:hypothetical protein